MKQLVLLFALITFAFLANAQQYSCIPPEHKTFFTNGKDYLRGMRIDSVKYVGAEKIYYPFKTARVRQHLDTYADTTGGSWWGSMIIEDTLTGITAIPTRYGDTVWIHPRAGLYDPWTFYRDTAVRYYEAEVIAIDTMTIAGISDSVKVVRIIAKDSNTEALSDPLNGLELRLSQHHGLLQAIGFYLFPYKGRYAHPDFYLSLGGAYVDESRRSFMFERVPFHYPINESVFDFDIGDEFYGDGRSVTNSWIIYMYSILSSYSGDTTFSYIAHYSITLNGIVKQGIDTFTYKFGNIVDTNKMPEEWYNKQIMHYVYQDKSFCVHSSKYQFDLSLIDTDGYFHDYNEGHFSRVLKERLGYISYDKGSEANGSTTYSMIWATKDSTSCYELGLGRTFAKNKNILVYPNPASNTVTVSSESDKVFSVQILDLTGRLLIQQNSQQEQLSIPIENLPNGLYLLKVSSGNEMLTKKLSVLHE
ncbi:MAG TPA: T9SS type A sorting domain-containing protein [Edaphocola sp.]|nr:T9SS type A sorting domain-containing protein [Edaphocola sp.]